MGVSAPSLHRESTDSLIGIGQSPQHQTCTFQIFNFHFHYGSNLTSSSIPVKGRQNVNCTWENTICDVFYMQKCISQIVHLFLLNYARFNERLNPQFLRLRLGYSTYRIAGNFRGVKFQCFSWLRGEPRNFYPQNSTA